MAGCEEQPAAPLLVTPPTSPSHTPHSPCSTHQLYLEPLICGIKEQFDAILSQIQYEVMAEGHLEDTEISSGMRLAPGVALNYWN